MESKTRIVPMKGNEKQSEKWIYNIMVDIGVVEETREGESMLISLYGWLGKINGDGQDIEGGWEI